MLSRDARWSTSAPRRLAALEPVARTLTEPSSATAQQAPSVMLTAQAVSRLSNASATRTARLRPNVPVTAECPSAEMSAPTLFADRIPTARPPTMLVFASAELATREILMTSLLDADPRLWLAQPTLTAQLIPIAMEEFADVSFLFNFYSFIIYLLFLNFSGLWI